MKWKSWKSTLGTISEKVCVIPKWAMNLCHAALQAFYKRFQQKLKREKILLKITAFGWKYSQKQRFQFRDIEGQIILMIFKIDLNHVSALLLFFFSGGFLPQPKHATTYIKIQMLLFPRNGWMSLVYKIGKWTNFKFDIAFFRGLTITITISRYHHTDGWFSKNKLQSEDEVCNFVTALFIVNLTFEGHSS